MQCGLHIAYTQLVECSRFEAGMGLFVKDSHHTHLPTTHVFAGANKTLLQ